MADKQKRMRVHPNHWELLLNFLEKHPEMLTGKFICLNAKYKSQELWKDVTSKLNSLGLGEKTPEKWKTSLQDWKYKVKMKIAVMKTSQSGTIGAPTTSVKLTPQEERLMSIVGWSAVGNENIPESGVSTTFLSQEFPNHSEDMADKIPKQEILSPTTKREIHDMEFSSHSEDVPDMVPKEEILSPTTKREIHDLEFSTHSEDVPDMVADVLPEEERLGPTPKRRRKYNTDEVLAEYQEQTIGVLDKIADNVNNVANELKTISSLLKTCVEVLIKKN